MRLSSSMQGSSSAMTDVLSPAVGSMRMPRSAWRGSPAPPGPAQDDPGTRLQKWSTMFSTYRRPSSPDAVVPPARLRVAVIRAW
ncbi:hypothetical protein GA0115280_103345 [Streptomyces sp. Cmuel-A718b]|nr:hypothetical protein GA0115280_103345 [Streptomyces sp. Cmuel-A718b]